MRTNPVHAEAGPELMRFHEAIVQLSAFVLAVNARTPHAAFFEISGHTSELTVSLRKSKDEWQETLFEADLPLFWEEEGAADDEALFYRQAAERVEHLQRKLERVLAGQ